MKHLIIASFFILFLPRSTCSQIKLQWLNPLPQGNLLLDLHTFNSNNILAVGRAGTFAQSTDSGLSWNVVSCFQNFSGDYSAISFATRNIGMIAGDSGVIIRTTNQGATWSRLNTGTTQYFSDIAHFNKDTAIATGAEAFQTTDGGNTWRSVSEIPVRSIAIVNQNTAVGISIDGAILRTSNAGNSWESLRLGNNFTMLFAICFANSRVGFITGFISSSDTTRGTFCMRTTDAGLSWHIRSSGGSFGIRTLAALDTTTLITIGESGEAYRSIDGGTSWLRQSTPSPLGSTITSIAFSHSDTGFAVGNFGYIMRTIDGGRVWTELSQRIRRPYYFMNVAFSNRQVGIAVSAFGEIHRTTDGGSVWLRQTFDTTLNFSNAEFITQTAICGVGGYGNIAKSTNSGRTWSRQNSTTSELLKALDFVDENIGYVVGFEGAFLKTTNGGVKWRASPINDYYFFDVAFADAMRGLIVGEDGLILQTTDGGDSWLDRSYRFGHRFIYSVAFIDQETAVAVGSEGIILRSTNEGISWNRVTNENTNHLYAIDFADVKNGITVGEGGTILQTTNGGYSWFSLKSGTSNVLSSVSHIDSVTAVIGGEGGTILRLTLDAPTSVENTLPNQPTSFALSQNYPNPFNSSTTITYRLPQASHVTIKIFDLLGREIETLVEEIQEAGEYSVAWSPNSLSSGVYFYRLQTPFGMITRKLLYIR